MPRHGVERYRRASLRKHSTGCLRRHPQPARLTGWQTFAYLRGRSLTDDLVDLIETIRHIGSGAEPSHTFDNKRRASRSPLPSP